MNYHSDKMITLLKKNLDFLIFEKTQSSFSIIEKQILYVVVPLAQPKVKNVPRGTLIVKYF